MTGVPENKTVGPTVELTVGTMEEEDPEGFVEATSQQETETEDSHKRNLQISQPEETPALKRDNEDSRVHLGPDRSGEPFWTVRARF